MSDITRTLSSEELLEINRVLFNSYAYLVAIERMLPQFAANTELSFDGEGFNILKSLAHESAVNANQALAIINAEEE